MSRRSRRECHDPLCCPVGLREHIENYRNQRHYEPQYRVGLLYYIYWELRSAVGLNTVLCTDCEFDECKKHDKPPLTLSQRLMSALRQLGRSKNAPKKPTKEKVI